MSELRANLAEVLDRVEAGEDVVVTRHGKPAAVIARPDRVRPVRVAHLYAAADELRERMERARSTPLPIAEGLTLVAADELVAEVRAGREQH